MTDRVLLADGMIDLRLGRWQDVLADVETCDAVITDPPYSPRTDKGYRTATDFNETRGVRLRADGTRRGNGRAMPRTRFELQYAPLDEDGAAELASWTKQRARQWAVIFGDHESFYWHERFFSHEWLTFAPVIWLRRGSAPRFCADGPASSCEYILVARPLKLPSVRASRPGSYEHSIHGDKVVTGGKPLALMRAIVRDYTRPGDLVVDPFCGGGTTALACAIEGRRCITSEMDPVTFEKARRRLERGFTPSMFQRGPKVKAKQGVLCG